MTVSPNALHNVDYEKYLLSSLLLKEGEVIPAVRNIIETDDFYRPEHRIIFDTILNAYDQKEPINLLTLTNKLNNAGKMDEVGIDFVFSLPEYAPTTAYSEYYAGKIKDMSNSRRLLNDLRGVAENLITGLTPLDEIYAQLNTLSSKGFRQQENSKLYNFADYLRDNFKADVEENFKYSSRKTGFDNLDEQQIFSSGLYVLGATPACGKTTFSVQIAYQLSKRGEIVYFCSFEMSKLELFAKNLSRQLFQLDDKTTLTAADIRKGGYNASLQAVIQEEQQAHLAFNVLELHDENVDDLLKLLRPLCVDADRAPVIIIDYLQILAANSKKDNARLEVDDTARKLKTFQRETNTTFIVISSFNRNSYLAPASFLSFKESGGIEFAADVVWALQLNVINKLGEESNIIKQRELFNQAMKQKPRELELKCLKNRQGTLYECYFEYYAAHDFFNPCTIEDFQEVAAPPVEGKPRQY